MKLITTYRPEKVNFIVLLLLIELCEPYVMNAFTWSTVYSHRHNGYGYHKGKYIVDINYQSFENLYRGIILFNSLYSPYELTVYSAGTIVCAISEADRNKYVDVCLYVIMQKFLYAMSQK